MSLQIMPQQVLQESSAKVTAAFKDTDSQDAVTPISATWSLMALDGTIINSRSNVAISSPTSSEEIWLTGDDLQLLDNNNEYELRKFLLQATYNNGASVVPLTAEGQFSVYNVTGVS